MSSIAGNTTTTEILTPGEIFTSSIDTTTDADWFRVNLTAGLSYSFTVEGFGGPGIGLPDPDLFLYNSAGSQLTGSSDFNNGNSLVFSPQSGGVFYVGVADVTNPDTGGYRLTGVFTDNIVNNTNTARTMAAGQTVASRIDVAGDRDWVKVTMTAGYSYGFRAEAGGGADQLDDVDLVLYNSSGNAIVTSGNFNDQFNTLNHLAAQNGTYYIEVSDFNGTLDTGTYNLSWVTSDNIFNSTATQSTLARNTSITSRIDVLNDSDWFRITLVEGISYGFQVARNGTAGLPDGDVVIRNTSGNIIANAGTNFNEAVYTLGYTAAASGTFFVEVSDSNEFGAYILRNLGLDAHVNNTDTNLSLRDGTRLSGRIDVEADSDWVKFRAEQGVTYQFQLSGTGAADEIDAVRLILRDANGNEINATNGATGVLTFTAATDGNLFLDVRGQSFADKGAFLLSVISTAPRLNGTAAADRLTGGANNTVINGFDGSDILNGSAGNDFVIGGLGLDTLLGGDGNDTLSGGTSADNLSGGAGGDRINGGAGTDVLRGGLNSDFFIFNAGDGSDTIVDFQNGADRIEIQSGATSISGLSIRQVGDDVRVVFGTTTILIENAERAGITTADFLFT